MSATKLILPVVEVALATDPGKDPDKQVNEDCGRHGETPFGHLAVLCDGMGGHEGGREASTLAVASIFRHVQAAALRADIPAAVRAREILKEAILFANHEVFAMGEAKGRARPGSTVVATLVHPLGTEVAHVGDSRCYLVHEGQIRQVTRDHSMVQQFVDAGQLTPEQAAAHPDANMITRALGMSETVDVELQPTSVMHVTGDSFVLCSDGLSDLVRAPEILQIVSSAPSAPAATQLIDLANARGGHDNITVMLVRACESARAQPDVPSNPMALLKTEAMPAVAAPPASPGSRPTLAMSEPTPLIPPAPPSSSNVSRRRKSPAVVIGALVGLVGVVAIGVAIYLLAVPREESNDVPALDLPVTPGASGVPGTEPPVDVDAGSSDAAHRGHRPRKRPRK